MEHSKFGDRQTNVHADLGLECSWQKADSKCSMCAVILNRNTLTGTQAGSVNLDQTEWSGFLPVCHSVRKL